MWKTPTFKEVAVGLEINCYACAEIQKVADDFDVPRNIDMAATMAVIKKLMPNVKFFDIGTAEQNSLINKYGVKKGPRGPGAKLAKGGMIKKYAMGGGVRKANYK